MSAFEHACDEIHSAYIDNKNKANFLFALKLFLFFICSLISLTVDARPGLNLSSFASYDVTSENYVQ